MTSYSLKQDHFFHIAYVLVGSLTRFKGEAKKAMARFTVELIFISHVKRANRPFLSFDTENENVSKLNLTV